MLDASHPFARPSRLRTLLFALLALALVAPLALAQEEPGEEGDEFDPRVYLNTEEDADGLIRAAWRARESGNWRAAIEKYLETIREYGGTVFASNERLYLPVRKLVRKELSELPKEGKAVYKLIKGRESNLAYRRAMAGSDIDGLKRIASDYPCLPAAPRALYLLGEWSRARGASGRALYYWQQLLTEYPDWEEASRAAVITRAALVAAESGRVAEGYRLLAALKKTSGLAKLRVGSTEGLVADRVARRLKAAGPGRGATAAVDAGYWPTIGGSPAHDRCAPRVVDAGVRRWQNPLSAAAVQSRSRYYGRKPVAKPAEGPPRRHPVCAGGMVYLAGNQTVLAVRAMSGSTVWAASRGKVDEKLGCSRMTLPALGEGKVFVVQGNPAPSTSRFRPNQGTYRSEVKLRAYAIGGGKLRWESGAKESKKVREFLTEIDLVSAPVYDSGYVYVPAVKRGSINDLYICCFDAADGRLVWKTFVCAGYPMKVGHYYNATSVLEDALPPAISEGLIAFVSNVGAVSVLDAASGQLLWVYLYDRIEPPKTDGLGRQVITTIESWAPSPPIVSDGLFICAPQDSPHLLAFDLATGTIRWRSRRGKLKHLVGVSGGKLIASGGREVVGFSLRSGKRLWRGLLDDEEAGLGQVASGFAVIPTRKSFQRFDLKTGKLVARFRLKDGAAETGNLLVVGDVMVSAGNRAFGGYYAWKEITTKLNRQIAARPRAAGPRATLGEVYFSAEKYADAARIFKEALSRARPGETVGGVALAPVLRRQIWESFTRLGSREEKGSKFEGALGRYRQAHEYAVDDSCRMIDHIRFARCKEKLGRHPEAVADLQEVIARYPRETNKAGGILTPAGGFAKREIDRIIKARGREPYASFDRKAANLLSFASSVKAVRRVVDVYPNSSSVSPALIKLSEIFTARKKYADAASSLREHLFKRRGVPRELEVYARLALAYKGQEINGLARSVIRRMQRRNAEDSFKLAGKQWSVKEFAAKYMPKAKGPGKAPPAPDLTPPLATAWNYSGGFNAQIAPNTSKFDVTGAAFVTLNRREVVALDLTTGRKLWSKAGPLGIANRMMLTAVATSGSILAANGNRMRALSPATGETMWETQLFKAPKKNPRFYTQYTRMLAGDGIIAAIPTWRDYDPKTRRSAYKSRVLVLDEASGREVWSKDLGGQVRDARLADGTLLVTAYDYKTRKGKVVAFEIADGSTRFGAPLSANPQAMHVTDDLAVVPDRQNLNCYDLGTGKLKWRASLGGNSKRILAADETRVVAYSQGGGVYCYNIQTGKRLWKTSGISTIYHTVGTGDNIQKHLVFPVYIQKHLMFPVYNRAKRTYRIVAVNTDNGKIAWQSSLPTGSYFQSVLTGKTHAMATLRVRKGRGYVYERRTWNTKTGKLVATRKLKTYGRLSTHEGSILQITGTEIECLVPGGKTPGKKK